MTQNIPQTRGRMILRNEWSMVKNGSKWSVEQFKKWSVVSRVIKGLKPLGCHSVSFHTGLNHNYLSSLSWRRNKYLPQEPSYGLHK